MNTEKLLGKILNPENMDEAIKQVKSNKGAAGVDGMLTTELDGYRQGRCAQNAIEKALNLMNRYYTWIVDIDLEKFFDTVNHDKLMTLVAKRG